MKAETMERVFSVKVLKILNMCLYRQQANESGTYSLLGGGSLCSYLDFGGRADFGL
jgi:hypothetical protein